MLTFPPPLEGLQPVKQYFYWMNLIPTKYILYILKKISYVISPSNEPCVDSALEPNIESELPNAVIRGRIGCGKLGKMLQILEKKYHVYLSS